MPRRPDLSDLDCSVARTLEVVGDRWTLLVLRDAFYGVRRFDDFARDLGIARNVLTDRLNRLVDAGVLRKEPYQDRPVRHEYRLTARGRDLLPVILTMMHWGDLHGRDEDDAVPRDLVHSDCGAATHAEIVCASCGGGLTPFNTSVVPLPEVAREAVAERLAESSA